VLLCTEAAGLDRHALYQQAVQYPPGDIYWVCKFYRQYIGAKVGSVTKNPWSSHLQPLRSAFMTWFGSRTGDLSND
jgi:hypothetical protein